MRLKKAFMDHKISPATEGLHGGTNDIPLVTVIALCFNHARFLVDCLASIQRQTFQDFQLIITDDCSKDDSAAMITEWIETSWPTAVFIRHDRNVGLCRTLNEAIAKATGKYISMIATDDVWEPQKIATQLRVMEASSEDVAVVYSDAFRMNEHGEIFAVDFIAHHRRDFVPPSGRLYATIAQANFIPAMATLIRRDAILAVGGYDEALLFEDYDMWLSLSERFAFLFHDEKVARYREVSTSMVRVAFKNSSPAYVWTMFLIRGKMIASGLLDQRERQRQIELQWGHAYELFVLGDSHAAAALRESAMLKMTARPLLLALATSFGIRREHLRKLKLAA